MQAMQACFYFYFYSILIISLQVDYAYDDYRHHSTQWSYNGERGGERDAGTFFSDYIFRVLSIENSVLLQKPGPKN